MSEEFERSRRENNNKKLWVITEAYINRISGKVVYIQPLKLQASLRAHDLAW